MKKMSDLQKGDYVVIHGASAKSWALVPIKSQSVPLSRIAASGKAPTRADSSLPRKKRMCRN